MSTHWELLEGDTNRFAIKLAFVTDPHQGAGATRELAASWGALQVWA